MKNVLVWLPTSRALCWTFLLLLFLAIFTNVLFTWMESGNSVKKRCISEQQCAFGQIYERSRWCFPVVRFWNSGKTNEMILHTCPVSRSLPLIRISHQMASAKAHKEKTYTENTCIKNCFVSNLQYRLKLTTRMFQNNTSLRFCKGNKQYINAVGHVCNFQTLFSKRSIEVSMIGRRDRHVTAANKHNTRKRSVSTTRKQVWQT